MFEYIISLIAPHACLGCGLEGGLLCSDCACMLAHPQAVCYRCGTALPQLSICTACAPRTPVCAVQAATSYDAVAKDLVAKLKFGRAPAAALPIANLMANRLKAPKDAIVVPVPTATSRVRSRGYDQAALIAERVARIWGLPYASLLRRSGQRRQVGLSKYERHQLQSVFWCRASLAAKDVVLVDDVLTTGSTIEAAANALQMAGVRRVHVAVFAAA